MDLSRLKAGDRVVIIDGPMAEVLRPSEDGQWVAVRYIEDRRTHRWLTGREDLCSEGDVYRVWVPAGMDEDVASVLRAAAWDSTHSLETSDHDQCVFCRAFAYGDPEHDRDCPARLARRLLKGEASDDSAAGR